MIDAKQKIRYNKNRYKKINLLHKNYELETSVITNHEERQENIIAIGMTIITAISLFSFEKKNYLLSILVITAILWLIAYFANHAFSIFNHGMYRKSIESKINKLSNEEVCEWEHVYSNYYQKNPFLYIMLGFASIIGIIEAGISLAIIVEDLGYEFYYKPTPFIITTIAMLVILFGIGAIFINNVKKICDERKIEYSSILSSNRNKKI